jgi:hypothetical protein
MAGPSLHELVAAQDVEAVRHTLTGVIETGTTTRSANRMRFAVSNEHRVA